MPTRPRRRSSSSTGGIGVAPLRSRFRYTAFDCSFSKTPDGPTRSNPALGFLAEWRYEIDMTESAALYLRQRLLFTTEQTYAGAAPETGFGSTLLEVGLSRRLR